MKTRIVGLAFVLFSWAAASEAPKISVSATGSAKVVPTALQITVTLKEKASDAAAAVQALKAAQEKLAVKMIALGIKGEQIKGEMPSVVDKAAQNAIRQQRSGGRLKRKTAEEKPEIEMQQTVRATLPFTAKDLEGVLVEAELLKAKIKAAKWTEDKQADAGDDDDESGFNPNGMPNPGAINFAYFAPKSEAAHDQAMADALKKASETAKRTVKAMGKTEVELHSITVGSDAGSQAANPYYRYSRYGYDQFPEPSPPDDGMTSQTPQMSVTAQISAEYLVK